MLHNLDHILISPSKFGSGKRADNTAIPPLKRHEVVEGRIIKSIPPYHALLLIKGKQLVARTRVPLRPGDVVFFKVEQLSPECILKLVELRHERPAGVADLLKGSGFQGFPYKALIDILSDLTVSLRDSGPEKSSRILMRMWALLCRISLHPDKAPDPGFLKSFIDGSGMIWEHKLKSLLLLGLESRNQGAALTEHDLKGLALRSLADAEAMKFLSEKGVGRFIGALEQLQLLNLSGLEEKGKLLFIIPMQWDDGFSFAQLLIDLADKGADSTDEKDQNRVLNISLFLDMSSLGPVLVDASVFQKVIKIGFCVCNEKTQSLFNNHTGHLVKQIERHGFSVQQVTCRLEERGHLAETSLVDAILDPEEHYISIVI